jgi:hypothetical protein
VVSLDIIRRHMKRDLYEIINVELAALWDTYRDM